MMLQLIERPPIRNIRVSFFFFLTVIVVVAVDET